MPLPSSISLTVSDILSASSTLFWASVNAREGVLGEPLSTQQRLNLYIKKGQDGDWLDYISFDSSLGVISTNATLVSGRYVFPSGYMFYTSGPVGYVFEFRDLKKSTVYTFSLQAVDEAGRTLDSNNQACQFDATADVTPPTINGLSDVATADGATINWTVETGCTNKVEYGNNLDPQGNPLYEIANFAAGTAVAATGDTNPTLVITGLNPGVKYYYKVHSMDAQGNDGTSTGDFTVTASSGTGDLQWAISIAPSSGKFRAYGCAAHTDGTVYVVGSFIGAIDLGTGQGVMNNGGPYLHALLIKISPAGVIQWGRRVGTNGGTTNIMAAVTVDSDGNPIVAGRFESAYLIVGSPDVFYEAVDFGGVSKTSVGGLAQSDGFIAKYSPGSFGVPGALSWVKQLSGIYADAITAIDIGADDSIVGVGTIQSPTLDCGNGITVTKPGDATHSSVLIVKLNSSGVTQFGVGKGEAASDVFVTGVAIDSANNIDVAGWFLTTTNLGGSQLTSAGRQEVYRAVFSGTNGSHIYSAKMGSIRFDSAWGCAFDALTSKFFVVGGVQAADGQTTDVDWGFGAQMVYGSNTCIAAYSMAGTAAWQKLLGDGYSAGTHLAQAVATYNGGIFVTGNSGAMYMGQVNGQYIWLNCLGYFIMKLDDDGVYQWGKKAAGGGLGLGICTTATGHVVACGFFLSQLDFDGGTTITATLGVEAGFVAKYKV